MPVSQVSLDRLNEPIVMSSNQIIKPGAHRVNSHKNSTHNQTNTPSNPDDGCKWRESNNHKESDDSLLTVEFHWFD